MSDITSTLNAIKVVYLNTASDLSVLKDKFERELCLYDERFAPCSYDELEKFFDSLSLAIVTAIESRSKASLLESKLSPKVKTAKAQNRTPLRLVK